MFSNDKKIESIGQFVEEAKQWLLIRKEYTKLDIIDKVVQICTALTLTIVLSFLVVLILIYLSFSAAYALNDLVGSMSLGFLIISAFYTLLLVIIYYKRHSWIEKPLVKFLVGILLNDDDDTTDAQIVTKEP